MKVVHKFLLLFLILVLVICGCSSQKNESKQEITVSAAASLKDALTEIKNIYIKENKNAKIHLNFASSGTLRMQIEQGAPTDLFLSASEEHFQRLLKQGLIAQDNHKNLLKNSMVLITTKNNDFIKKVENLKAREVSKIALGIPKSVPAGKYGKETLEFYNMWDKVKNKIVFTKDVRQVLTYVETGNVDAGFVYQTDALLSDQVKVAEVIDEQAHAPIVYPAGVVKNSAENVTARGFYKFLQSEKAKRVFEKYGFKVMD